MREEGRFTGRTCVLDHERLCSVWPGGVALEATRTEPLGSGKKEQGRCAGGGGEEVLRAKRWEDNSREGGGRGVCDAVAAGERGWAEGRVFPGGGEGGVGWGCVRPA